ncbi:MAG: cytochrome c [Nitriliruptoraceae bacterium]
MTPRGSPIATRRRVARVVASLVLVGVVVACSSELPATNAAADPERGAELFTNNCAACHGPGAQGSAAGPPLVHEIYEPGHHGDEAFQLAVANGVRAHHWPFGDMPPVSGLDRAEVADIVADVRGLQREAGIID